MFLRREEVCQRKFTLFAGMVLCVIVLVTTRVVVSGSSESAESGEKLDERSVSTSRTVKVIMLPLLMTTDNINIKKRFLAILR